MRFGAARLSGAIRMAAQPPSMAQRGYASSTPTKKSGNGLLVATLAGIGIAGGIYYNQNKAEVKQFAAAEQKKSVSSDAATPAFTMKEFRSFKLQKVEPINHNTSLFRFELPEGQSSALPIASCVITRYPITKKDGSKGYVIRPYTPTSSEHAQGYVDFIIKEYPDGKMSKHIHGLKVGDELDIKGPIQKWDWENKTVGNVGMIAGGTGITPMLQVIRRVFDHPKPSDEKTKITLIFANQTKEDILLKDELDGYAKKYPDRFNVVYTLDTPPKDWQGLTGYVTEEAVQKHLPKPDEKDAVIFVCGPDPMLAALAGAKAPDKSQGELAGLLQKLGYTSSNVFKF